MNPCEEGPPCFYNSIRSFECEKKKMILKGLLINLIECMLKFSSAQLYVALEISGVALDIRHLIIEARIISVK